MISSDKEASGSSKPYVVFTFRTVLQVKAAANLSSEPVVVLNSRHDLCLTSEPDLPTMTNLKLKCLI